MISTPSPRHVGSPVLEEEDGAYRVTASVTPELTAAVAAWLAEHGATLGELRTGGTLEETYLALVSEQPAAAPEDDRPRAVRRGRRR